MHYILISISFIRGGSYIDSLEWLKNKKATISLKKMMTSAFNML